MIDNDEFRLLNEQHRIATPGDWNSPRLSRLWLYNAHYFDDLLAADATRRRAWHYRLIDRWIDQNPPALGCGWEPYPLSLRIVNWIKFHLSGSPIGSRALASLSQQVRVLRGKLEFHLMGNHLIANAKAMMFAGCFFSGPEADSWRTIGHRVLMKQLSEQVLRDGGHVERSPMYHSLVLEDLLDVLNILAAFSVSPPSEFSHAAQRMRAWLDSMTHPDGHISFFNDAALGVAPSPSELQRYAERLDLAASTLRPEQFYVLGNSGYVRLENEACVLLLDVAPLGPDYLPGHAHADTLSLECSLDGQRIIVNSGTSTYERGEKRSWQRSTAAHNTVTVDGHDSSEMWNAFRVARRAHPFGLEIDRGAGTVECSHDGYRRLPGRVTHTRRWRLKENGFAVSDELRGEWSRAVGRIYLHPDVAVTASQGAQSGKIAHRSTRPIYWSVTGAQVKVRKSTYFPEFNKYVPNSCLELDFADDSATVEFWY